MKERILQIRGEWIFLQLFSIQECNRRDNDAKSMSQSLSFCSSLVSLLQENAKMLELNFLADVNAHMSDSSPLDLLKKSHHISGRTDLQIFCKS